MSFLPIDSPFPHSVRALCTSRLGGISAPPYDSMNLADHVGDDPEAVAENRLRLILRNNLPQPPFWLTQVHGKEVVTVDHQTPPDFQPQADGAVTRTASRPLVILTADCLPVLASDIHGRVIGAFHCGWKGLLTGVLEHGLEKMGVHPSEILIWLGPSIGSGAYQVGSELRERFLTKHDFLASCFLPDQSGKWRMDLRGVAEALLRHLGVQKIWGTETCTFSSPEILFSYRRQNPCGRQAALIWIVGKPDQGI